MKNKKEKIIAILLVVGLIVATGSISYAAFRFSQLGSKVNTITTGSVTMSYTESSNVLNMSGALPTTDTTGKGRLNPGEYFDFTVSSSITGDTNINYEIAVEELSGSTMNGDYIKFYLTKVNTDGSEQGIFGPSTYSVETEANTYTGRPANMMSLYTSSMSASETTTYRLRMYVSEEYNPQGDGGNLTYKARVNVYGLAGDKIESGSEENSGGEVTIASLEAGCYTADWELIKSWNELIECGAIYESDSLCIGNFEPVIMDENSDPLYNQEDLILVVDESIIEIPESGLQITLKAVVLPNSISYMGYEICSSDNIIIYYKGTEEEWNNIRMDPNDNLLSKQIVFLGE